MTPVELVQRLLLAAALGAAIGIEREYRQKPAGLRTNILIAVGSALFTIVGLEMATHPGGAPDRVAANVITGIGFLGGGAILRLGHSVHGLTTAATIWVNAAIGMAAGMGLFQIASIAALMTLIALALLPPVESYFEARAGITPRSHMASPPRDERRDR